MKPDPELPEDDLVDEAGMESFPASDPPPFWARAELPSRPGAAPDGDRPPRGRARASPGNLRDGCFE